MTKVVDARGLTCPQPVVLTSRALTEASFVTTIVDNQAALENVTRLAHSRGFSVEVTARPDGIYLNLRKGETSTPSNESLPETTPQPVHGASESPVIFLVTSDCLGHGPAELGERLMGAFFHTLLEVSPKPKKIVFVNTGVKLAVRGSRAIDDLQMLVSQGVEVLACGTCLGYYELTDQLAAGRITNLYDVSALLLGPDKVVTL